MLFRVSLGVGGTRATNNSISVSLAVPAVHTGAMLAVIGAIGIPVHDQIG